MCSAGVMTKLGEKQSMDNLANKQSLLNPKKVAWFPEPDQTTTAKEKSRKCQSRSGLEVV